jgi:hypothetical protein
LLYHERRGHRRVVRRCPRNSTQSADRSQAQSKVHTFEHVPTSGAERRGQPAQKRVPGAGDVDHARVAVRPVRVHPPPPRAALVLVAHDDVRAERGAADDDGAAAAAARPGRAAARGADAEREEGVRGALDELPGERRGVVRDREEPQSLERVWAVVFRLGMERGRRQRFAPEDGDAWEDGDEGGEFFGHAAARGVADVGPEHRNEKSC